MPNNVVRNCKSRTARDKFKEADEIGLNKINSYQAQFVNSFMAYNEKLAARIRERLEELGNVEEKKMFRGITFMVNGKMCISVSGPEEIMCRFDPSIQENVIEQNGVREMVMRGKTMKGYVYVNESVLKTKKALNYWVELALEFNGRAKAAKKKK